MNTARQTLASGLQRPQDPGCARSGSCNADAAAFGCFLYGGNRGFCSAPPRPAPPRVASGNRACGSVGGGPADRDRASRSGAGRSFLGTTPVPTPCSPYRARVSARHLPARASLVPRPSPHLVRSPSRGRVAAEAEGPPGPKRADREGTTCPARVGASGAGRALLREPERAPAVESGRVRTRPWPSRAPAPRARGGASSWTVRWRPSGRERVSLLRRPG